MYAPIRAGTRGGQGDFKWEDVKNDKDRENYLGHSLHASVGRWQANKDITWYNKEGKQADEERRAELRKIKEAEEDALSVALGYAPTPRNRNPVEDEDKMNQALPPPPAASSLPSDPAHPHPSSSLSTLEQRTKEAEKAARKAEREQHRMEKEIRRAERELRREGKQGSSRQQQQQHYDRYDRHRSPPLTNTDHRERHRTIYRSRSHSPPERYERTEDRRSHRSSHNPQDRSRDRYSARDHDYNNVDRRERRERGDVESQSRQKSRRSRSPLSVPPPPTNGPLRRRSRSRSTS